MIAPGSCNKWHAIVRRRADDSYDSWGYARYAMTTEA